MQGRFYGKGRSYSYNIMFKVKVHQTVLPYTHMTFHAHVDTLYEAELVVIKLISGYFGSRYIELAYIGELCYDIYDNEVLVGVVSIIMLE